jgi:hypothetical protein
MAPFTYIHSNHVGRTKSESSQKDPEERKDPSHLLGVHNLFSQKPFESTLLEGFAPQSHSSLVSVEIKLPRIHLAIVVGSLWIFASSFLVDLVARMRYSGFFAVFASLPTANAFAPPSLVSRTAVKNMPSTDRTRLHMAFKSDRPTNMFDGPLALTQERDACGVGFIANTRSGGKFLGAVYRSYVEVLV